MMIRHFDGGDVTNGSPALKCLPPKNNNAGNSSPMKDANV